VRPIESGMRGPKVFRKDLAMSLKTLATEFVELCNQGKNFDVMRAMYAPGIVSVEAGGEETAGKTPVIQKSERWQANNTVNREALRGPFFNGPNQFAVHFTFDVTPKATGKPVTLEEVGVYTVEGDQITREEFFYDGER
jgi:SnoaL-like domain